MIHVNIQLKAYMLSNFHQTNHQSTYKNYQTMSFSASCALCQMVNNSNSRNYKAMKLSRLVNRFDRIRQDYFSFLGIKKGSVILCFTIEQQFIAVKPRQIYFSYKILTCNHLVLHSIHCYNPYKQLDRKYQNLSLIQLSFIQEIINVFEKYSRISHFPPPQPSSQ